MQTAVTLPTKVEDYHHLAIGSGANEVNTTCISIPSVLKVLKQWNYRCPRSGVHCRRSRTSSFGPLGVY